MRINIKNKYQLFIDFNVSVRRVEKRAGICSIIIDTDSHILLWDFDEITEKDNISYEVIKKELRNIQLKYALPNIYIYCSSLNHYHAHCYVSRSFKEIVHILSDTKYIDENYLMLGVARGYYTLRFSPKNGIYIKIRAVLKSDITEKAKPDDITINHYLTTNIK